MKKPSPVAVTTQVTPFVAEAQRNRPAVADAPYGSARKAGPSPKFPVQRSFALCWQIVAWPFRPRFTLACGLYMRQPTATFVAGPPLS
jgi:hypothetical protein